MCDYSLHSLKTRKAEVNDQLITRDFGTGTIGFATADDPTTAVCVMPGTEIAFESQILKNVGLYSSYIVPVAVEATGHTVGIFRQINKEDRLTHHDALELPGGDVVLLTKLAAGQKAKVLQLPAVVEDRLPWTDHTHIEAVADYVA